MRESDESGASSENVPAQPAPQADAGARQRQIVTSVELESVETVWEGPLPPPEEFRRYEETLPGAAERILTMAENQHQHRMNHENSALELEKFALETAKSNLAKDAARSTWGMALAFILGMTGLGCSTFLAAIDRWEAGLPLGLATIASLVGAFIHSVKTRRDERRERESEEE